MPAPDIATDADSSRTITSRTHETDPSNYASSNAHSTDNRSPQKLPKPTVNDSRHVSEPRPSTPQEAGHYEPRDRGGGSATPTKERGDSTKSHNHTARRDTEDTSHRRDQGDNSRRREQDDSNHSTRVYPPIDNPPPPPPRPSGELHESVARPSAQTQSTLPPQMTDSDSSSEYYDEQDLAALEQRQQANAASRSQTAKPDYPRAAGGPGSATRQAGPPREPRPSSNAEGPSLPPRPNRRPDYSQAGRLLRGFLPSSASSSDPARDKTKDDYNRLLVEHQRMRDDLKRFESENRHLRHANRDIDQDRTRHRENASALQNELRNVQRELDDYRNLSEIRGKELMGAQVFLTKADLLSASELSQKVHDLNEESFQAAAWFSESLVRLQRQWKSEEESQTAYQVACTMLGDPAARILVTAANEPEINPILIQLVMQIYFAKFCSAKIERWYEGSQETNDFLSTIYGEIRQKEEQAVSGRWRAITHALTRSSPDNWVRDFTFNLNRIMGIAAWEISSPDKRTAFEQQLKPIFKAILDIRIALGEHFTSADIEVFCPHPGAPFDSQRMEDALDDGRRKQKDSGSNSGSAGAILGTASIGLCEVPLRGARSGTDKIVLLPKVILQSTLQELLQPPSAPSRTKKSKSTPHAG